MKIKIIKCSNALSWYRHRIGCYYDVNPEQGDGSYAFEKYNVYFVKNSNGDIATIRVDDCDTIQEIRDKFIDDILNEGLHT